MTNDDRLIELSLKIEHMERMMYEHREATAKRHEELVKMIHDQNAVIAGQRDEIVRLKQIADRGYGALAAILLVGSIVGTVVSWVVSHWRQ